MKHLLFTIMVLLTAGTAMADNYFYIDDFEVDPGINQEIVVPVKAHFEGRLNGFMVDITYPDGITPVSVSTGSGMTVEYMDKNAANQTKRINLTHGNDFKRFLASIGISGYWYGPNGLEEYGAVKWEAGDYDEMFLLTLEVDESFEGGDIELSTMVSSGEDTRGGTVGTQAYGSSTCQVTLIPVILETPAPTITYDSESATVVCSAVEGAELQVFIDGELVGQSAGEFTYVFNRTNQTQTHQVSAIAQLPDYEPSETVTLTVTVSAINPNPNPAGNYLYIDDFEIDPDCGQITVPVKAHFDGRLNAFQLDIIYPDGITPVRAAAGRDMTVEYMDVDGENQTKAVKLNKNDELFRFIGAIEVGGYWYGPNGFEQYGAVKWEAGDYDEMFFLTLQVDESFMGGEIQLETQVSSGNDTRGGTVGRLEYGSSTCYVSLRLLPDEVTPAPVITYDDETATVTVWSDMEGAMLQVSVDGELVSEDYGVFTYTFTRTDEPQVHQITAIAQAPEYEPSNPVDLTITVSANAVEPDPEPTNNNLTLADADAIHTNTVVIPLSMTNVDEMTAFQTDVCLPEGFELLKQDGEFVIETSSRLSDHLVMANTRPDGSVRIMCYSPTLSPIAGNEGELLYVTVVVPNGADGEYTLTLKNNIMTTMTYEEVRCAETSSMLYVQSFIYGDADNSGTVTVTDVVVAARYVLGYDVDNFVFDAADMNGDGTITVTDVVLIACQVLYPQGYSLLRTPVFGTADDLMSAEDINLPQGETRTVTIALDNELDYTAFQLDLLLPDGLTASNFCLTSRAGSHAVDANTLGDGTLRVICYSPELTAINGNEGALLTFDVTAVGNVAGSINVDGIEMVTTAFQTVNLDAFAIGVNTVSAVNEVAAATRIYSNGHDIIVETPVDQVVTVCDMAGRAQQVKVTAGYNVIPAPGNGVYIVSARGTNAKLMLK